jgi:hypothetical protein
MGWIIRHKTTTRTDALVRHLFALAREIEDSLLDVASSEARGEWATFRGQWPTTAEVRSGRVCLSDDEIEFVIAKVVRFKAILSGLARLDVMLLAAA